MSYDAAGESAALIAAAMPGPYRAAIVLGSGLDALAERVEPEAVLPYAQIPNFPDTTVAGHAGRLVLGRLRESPVLLFQGRFHYYEGHPLDVVTFPVRVLARLGVRTLILTAAAGGIGDDLAPGSIVVLNDHLNLLGQSPLRGPNDDRFGPRFPDLSETYDRDLRELATREAIGLGIAVTEGVYACVAGPNYETPAEVRMLRTLGADVVGMSTVPEAIVARHLAMKILAFAVVANRAAGLQATPLSHAEVLETVQGVSTRLADLLEALVPRLNDPS